MNIAFICNEYPPAPAGGIGTWTQAFARALVRRGDNAHVIGIYPARLYPLKARLEEDDNGVHVIRLPASQLPKEKLRAFDNRLRLRLELARLHRQHHFDIVEVPDYQGYGVFLERSCPMVVRLHHLPKRWSDPEQARQSVLIHWFEDRALNRADLVIAVSHWTEEVTLKVHPRLKNIVVNYYTVSDLFLQPPDEAITRENNLVIFAGTLAQHKGIWELARAWEMVKTRLPQARLVMIGKDLIQDGHSNREKLQRQLAGKDVTFVDHVSQQELQTCYYRAAVACFPSKSETFGLVAAEAMACGTPVIYTKVGPWPEVMGDGDRGLLIDPNSPAEIADAICEILANPEAQRARCERAAQWVRENLGSAATVSQTRQLYQQLVDNQSDWQREA